MDELWRQIAQHGPWAALTVLLVWFNQRNYEATILGLNKNAEAMNVIAKALTELSAAVQTQPEKLRAVLHGIRETRRGHGD